MRFYPNPTWKKRSAYLSYVRCVESSRMIRLVYAMVEKKKVIEKNIDANVLRQRKRVDINVV